MTYDKETYKVKTINKEKYLIPRDLNINPHKHRKKKNWVSLWFYKQRRKTSVLPNQISTDRVITSKLEYQKDIFYKMSSMSREDSYFDYYFKLKDNTPKDLVKKNNRYKKSNPHKKIIKVNEYQSKPYKRDASGKFIVTFK